MNPAWLVCAALSLVSATVMAAPTVYTYTGAFFSSIGGDDSSVPGAYTTSMSIRGSITLTDAIAPDESLSFFTGDGDPRLLRFSFNDGRTEFTHDNGVHAASSFSLTADAGGNVSTWFVSLLRVSPTAGIAEAALRWSSSCGSGLECDESTHSSLPGPGGIRTVERAINHVPGDWAISPVPEPASYGLFLFGLAVVGYAAKRRLRLPG